MRSLPNIVMSGCETGPQRHETHLDMNLMNSNTHPPTRCVPRASVVPLLISFLALCTLANAAHPVVERFDAYDPAALLNVTNGTFEKAMLDGKPVLRWRINTGQTSELSLRPEHPVFDHLRYFDHMQFEFRIASGEIDGLGVRALGIVSGARQHKVQEWNMAMRTTPAKVWHSRDADFTRPNWFPWDNPDGEGRQGYLMFSAVANAPDTVIELRDVRLLSSALLVKPFYELPITWPVKTVNADGGITYRMTVQVLNISGKPADITARVTSAHQRFKIELEKPVIAVKTSIVADFTIAATMSRADIAASPELYAEPLRLAFTASSVPDAEATFETTLVRPLSAGLHRQVVLKEDELKTIREKIAAGDKEFTKLIEHDRIIKAADEFMDKELRQIPPGHQWPGTNPGTDWAVGKMMPEIVNKKTGETQTGTILAGLVWKRYLTYPGYATENLGLAYLMTQDERYARKAVELFRLYAQQYGELKWNGAFELPWLAGASIGSSSRMSSGSPYGTNIFMKNHVRLLSMIADSTSWSAEDRALIYSSFITAYAAELMKFNGGINNMTDITNHNLLLLGVVFDDALMVHRATAADAGLLARVADIDHDGFSSEGRPIGYQFAGMTEYLPSLVYLDNAGLKLPFDKNKLLAAMRMPYQRATLTGWAPNCGDCARGYQAGVQPLAAYLVSMFPDEQWLLDICGKGNLSSNVRRYLAQVKPDPKAWTKLLETKPKLFPEAGFVILRSGTTAEDQVMVTLDYGRAFFHNGANRNQLTLAAFGALLAHDPGSLYNVGRDGMTRTEDKQLDSFSLNHTIGYNVIIADAQDQTRASGRLLAWSPEPEMQVAVSRVDGVFPGVNHTRGVALTEGVVVVIDRMDSDAEHAYDFAYHNLGKLKPGDGWTASPTDHPLGTTANYENIKELKKLSGSGAIRLSWDVTEQHPAASPVRTSGAALELWQLPIAGGEVFTGVTGLNNPNTKTYPDTAPSLFHRVRGRSVEFCTVLDPRKGQSHVKAVQTGAGGGIAVELQNGKRVNFTLDDWIKRYAVKK